MRGNGFAHYFLTEQRVTSSVTVIKRGGHIYSHAWQWMDHVRNFIVYRRISSLMDLCDGPCLRFYRLIDCHNQQFDGLMRWTLSAISSSHRLPLSAV